ncbi:Aldehyde Dehydrogenase [Geobacter metallireducens RCH3]|uniref:Salicylaldehyde dehydrogenase n=1 Tax=Geobacter metallireducens (strain ATCC 53774 / DSM 7210 / GS-15) TaxID=269799 RepID=Q39TR4_GEOMG|nr:aldehyde dehydrogenase family protein [Geobacter metallireducens]ABB32360.1 p-hydroxybenzaldehyde dehydrogenase, putative [Geobacter metallireducens GS-15]EHP86750.1 Aldehyde Dehydrogenase [Geobacter metallireducens RCH3]
MKEYRLFINGEWVPSSTGTMADDINPATGDVYAKVHQASRDDIEQAIASAYRARVDWGKTVPAQREAILIKAAAILEERIPEFAEVLIEEGGATFGKAMFESSFVVTLLRSAAGECRRIFGETIPSDAPGLFSMSVRRPLGVIAGISPFNFPFLLAMKKVALALAAGNTFVLKPASPTPVIGLKIAELFEAAGLPKGVLNVIPVKGSTLGNTLVEDPRIRMVTFTGSTDVGKQLAEVAGRHQKKITLEMGGKSPLIVLKDADIDYAVDAAVFGIFLHQGQVCMANSRLIVEADIYDRFCEKLTAKVKGLKMGDPHKPDTVIGPLIDAKQCAFIDSQVHDALADGARVLSGGRSEGAFYQPTIVADVTRKMRIFDEESFGPVVCVIKAANSEEALALANDSSFGLSAGLITNDLQKAFDLSLRLESGMVHINDSSIFDEPHVPFGGVKDSGVGREGGHYSMEEMTEVKWITVQMGKRQFPF